jgi:colanic acid/amylovoran biosynthesis glycosyltransferase
MTECALVAVQSLPTWLPLTSPWLFQQIARLPESVETHVVCARTANLDQFHIRNLHVLRDHSATAYLWQLGVRWFGVRHHLPFLVNVTRRCRGRIIHSHWGDTAWRDLEAVRQCGTRHIATFYGKDVNYLPTRDARWRARYGKLFARVDRVLCEGPHMGHCIERLGCPQAKITVHHLGVDTGRIDYRPRAWSPGTPLRVLIAASFREKKGIPLALRALGRVRAEVGNLEVTLIGDASDDARSKPEKSRILAAIGETGLGGSVRLLGYQPHAVLFEEAYRHHVFISPSLTARDGDTEGGAPVTLVDMAATGMPIVSSTHCDIPEVVRDGQTGWLAAEGDLDSLVNRLRECLATSHDWPRRLAAGRARMESEFDAYRQSARLARIYAEVLTRDSVPANCRLDAVPGSSPGRRASRGRNP